MFIILDLAALLIIGGLICEGVEGLIYLGLVFLGLGLLECLLPAIQFLLFLAVGLAGVYIGGRGGFKALCWWIEVPEKRALPISVFVLCVPICMMLVTLGLAGMTGDWFETTKVITHKESYWFFWTKDVVTEVHNSTIWKKWLDYSFTAFLIVLAIVPIDWLIWSFSRSKKEKPAGIYPLH